MTRLYAVSHEIAGLIPACRLREQLNKKNEIKEENQVAGIYNGGADRKTRRFRRLLANEM